MGQSRIFTGPGGRPIETGIGRPPAVPQRPGRMIVDPNDPRMAAYRATATAREIAKMKAYNEQYKQRFISLVEDVASRNPEIKPEVFQAIVDEYMKQAPMRERDMLRAYKENPTPAMVQADLQRIKEKYGQQLQDKIYKDYGDAGLKAMQEISREMQPKSIFSGIVKHFYNSDKGGLQIGATAGAGIGLLLGLLVGNKMGGAMSFAAPAVGVIIATILGGKFDTSPEVPRPKPDFHSKYRPKTREPSKDTYVDKTIGKPAVDPVVKVELDSDPTRSNEDYKGVIISVTDKKNPAYVRTYAGVYDPKTKDLHIDTTRFNGPENWVELSKAVTIRNVDMQIEGGALKSYALTQDQLEPARKQAEARAGKKDVMADVTPDFQTLLDTNPPSVNPEADARTMGIRTAPKPGGPALQ